MNAECKRILMMSEHMQKEYERVVAERDALHAALRRYCIFPAVRRCMNCHECWSVGESEKHTPECLAAPRDGA